MLYSEYIRIMHNLLEENWHARHWAVEGKAQIFKEYVWGLDDSDEWLETVLIPVFVPGNELVTFNERPASDWVNYAAH